MISMYKWQQIKVLGAAGMGIKSIAKKVGVSKNTVRRYLRSIEPPQFKTREYEKMLDGYGDEIKEMLTKRYIGTRIFSELSKIGYQGSLYTGNGGENRKDADDVKQLLSVSKEKVG